MKSYLAPDVDPFVAINTTSLKEAQESVSQAARDELSAVIARRAGASEKFVDRIFFTDEWLSPRDADRLWLAIDNNESKQKNLDSYMATATGERDLSESKPRTDLLRAYGRSRLRYAAEVQRDMDKELASRMGLNDHGSHFYRKALHSGHLRYTEGERREAEILYYPRFPDYLTACYGYRELLDASVEHHYLAHSHLSESEKAEEFQKIIKRYQSGMSNLKSEMGKPQSNTLAVAKSLSSVLVKSLSGRQGLTVEQVHREWTKAKVRSHLRLMGADPSLFDEAMSNDNSINPFRFSSDRQAESINQFDTDTFRRHLVSLKSEKRDLSNSVVSDVYHDCMKFVEDYRERLKGSCPPARVHAWLDDVVLNPADQVAVSSMESELEALERATRSTDGDSAGPWRCE